MVAEGNFYISEVTIHLPLHSKVAKAAQKCKSEGEAYAKCVDSGQINRALTRGACEVERVALRKCTDVNWSLLRRELSLDQKR